MHDHHVMIARLNARSSHEDRTSQCAVIAQGPARITRQ